MTRFARSRLSSDAASARTSSVLPLPEGPCSRHQRNQRCAEACKRAWRERDSRARAHQAQRGCARRAIFGGATAQHDAADASEPTPEIIDDDSAEAHFEGGGATCPVLPLSLLLRVILVSVLARVLDLTVLLLLHLIGADGFHLNVLALAKRPGRPSLHLDLDDMGPKRRRGRLVDERLGRGDSFTARRQRARVARLPARPAAHRDAALPLLPLLLLLLQPAAAAAAAAAVAAAASRGAQRVSSAASVLRLDQPPALGGVNTSSASATRRRRPNWPGRSARPGARPLSRPGDLARVLVLALPCGLAADSA